MVETGPNWIKMNKLELNCLNRIKVNQCVRNGEIGIKLELLKYFE